MRRSKLAWQATKFAGRTTERAVVGLARWATTDHTGISKIPWLGFVDTLKYSAMFLLISIAGILVSGILYFLLFAYGIPFLLSLWHRCRTPLGTLDPLRSWVLFYLHYGFPWLATGGHRGVDRVPECGRLSLHPRSS